MKKIIMTLCIIGVTLSFANEQHREGRGECKPPQEAIDVCEGKATDTTCQMTSRRGDLVTGTCKYTPDEEYFACKPEHGPRNEK